MFSLIAQELLKQNSRRATRILVRFEFSGRICKKRTLENARHSESIDAVRPSIDWRMRG